MPKAKKRLLGSLAKDVKISYMVAPPEQEPVLKNFEIPDEPEIGESAREAGVSVRPVYPKVSPPLTPSSGATTLQRIQSVEFAYPQNVYEDMSKGSASDSKTWYGAFNLRRIKKALLKGLRVILKTER